MRTDLNPSQVASEPLYRYSVLVSQYTLHPYLGQVSCSRLDEHIPRASSHAAVMSIDDWRHGQNNSVLVIDDWVHRLVFDDGQVEAKMAIMLRGRRQILGESGAN